MSAKGKVVPFQPPVPDEDEEPAHKCPPPGAPAWLATFADIATNLMAFFVLILGFAKFDEPSFQEFAGAMRAHFGMFQGSGGADTIINLAPVQTPDAPPPAPDSGADQGGSTGKGAPDGAAGELLDALREALAEGRLEVDAGSGTVTVKLPGASGPAAAQDLAEAIASATGTEPVGTGSSGTTGTATGATAGGPDGAGPRVRGEMTAHTIQTVLGAEIADGALSVEQRDGKVFVTLGAGGAFASGSADLTAEAQSVMARIAEASDRPGRSVVVTGHTDNVPLSGGPFVDNVGLAAARAASVVRELVGKGGMEAAQVSAVSQGEARPVADNATEEGRARNRRIEIEIGYAD